MLTPRLQRYAQVDSTQHVCQRHAENGVTEGLVVVADEQTAGRGRMGHTWYSPPGQAIYASLLLRPKLTVPQTNWITMIAAMAVIDTVADMGLRAGISPTPTNTPTIKWFNDIFLNGKKLCGILVETSVIDEEIDHAILGVGLNVNTDFGHAPDEVRERATSLREAWGISLDRERVLAQFLDRFAARYAALGHAQQSPAAAYAAHVDTLGKWVRVQAADNLIEGLAVGVDDLGGLRVQTASGERIAYFGHVLSAMPPPSPPSPQ